MTLVPAQPFHHMYDPDSAIWRSEARKEGADDRSTHHRQRQALEVCEGFEGFAALSEHPAAQHVIYGRAEHQNDHAGKQPGANGEYRKRGKGIDIGEAPAEELQGDFIW